MHMFLQDLFSLHYNKLYLFLANGTNKKINFN